MKRLISLFSLLLIFVSILNFNSCKPDSIEELGSIYGVVTDKATGEPVKNANVQLRPSGETTLTGTDGRYEFVDLKNGEYSITVSKTEYTDLVDDYVIVIDGDKAMRRDVQIEKIPAVLRILDSNGNDIDELNFGYMQDDNTRMFSVFNNSMDVLEYEILKTAVWVSHLSTESGLLQPGATKPIVVTIDRSMLSPDGNITTLNILTNNGGKQLTIKANMPDDGGDDGGEPENPENPENPEEPDEPNEPDDPSNPEINGHEYVDLGLPSGLKWATCNVGASSPEMAGGYYAWGELETKDSYYESNSLTYNVEMQDISGNPDYDVARSEWGATWRIPKYAEVTELFNNCTRAEVDINGRKCIKLTSSINGKYIILPHTGWMSGMSNAYYNSYGRYWSSMPYSYNDYSAYYFSSAGSGLWENVRSWGLSVRPVSN